MNDDLRGERLQLMLTGEELKALDDFRLAGACRAAPRPCASC